MYAFFYNFSYLSPCFCITLCYINVTDILYSKTAIYIFSKKLLFLFLTPNSQAAMSDGLGGQIWDIVKNAYIYIYIYIYFFFFLIFGMEIFEIFENFWNLGNFGNFWKFLRFGKFSNFGNFEKFEILNIFEIMKNFEILEILKNLEFF